MTRNVPSLASTAEATPALAAAETLGRLVDRVEDELTQLSDALHRRDVQAIESHAQDLHNALERAVDGFSGAARGGQGIPPALRNRLVAAGGRVAAQRESLARATVALDRAMDVLLPAHSQAPLYGAQGQRARSFYTS